MNTLMTYSALVIAVIYQTLASFINLFVPRFFIKKKNIKGQIILITGAGSGVGRQLAIEFSKHATCLILVDINSKWLMETEKLLDRRSSVFTYNCDVSDYKKVYELARKVKEEAGDVDILVNNAGIMSGKHLLHLPEERIIKTMEVNALAHIWTNKAFLPAMLKKNYGHIVSIASLAGKAGIPQLTDYCASKFAAIGFAEALEIELRERGRYGIKVTIVCTSHIDTGLFEGAKTEGLGPSMSAEYVAKEVVLGVLEEQEMIVLPRFCKLLCVLKEFVPRWMMIKVTEISGNLKAMENFTGREPNGVSKPETKTERSRRQKNVCL